MGFWVIELVWVVGGSCRRSVRVFWCLLFSGLIVLGVVCRCWVRSGFLEEGSSKDGMIVVGWRGCLKELSGDFIGNIDFMR